MRRSLAAAGVVAAVIGASASWLAAQEPPAPDPLPEFEVAAVKENRSGQGFIRFGVLPGGRFTAENAPARELLRFAYQLQSYQMEGLPGWASSDRFDVTAKAEGDVPPPRPGQAGALQYMMRALLRDRFGLVYHHETKEMPLYHLVRARSDGRLGPKLEASTTDCAAVSAGRRGGGPGGPGGGPPPPPSFGEKMVCGLRGGSGILSGGDVPLTQLALFLSQSVGRTVLDKTGLEGAYNFELTYTPDPLPTVPPGGGPQGLPPIDPNGPSLTTALQEQLGLKLDATRGPVTMFVVDKIAKPTPD
jgi:uncharacterized protein (TIGR03435 family)